MTICSECGGSLIKRGSAVKADHAGRGQAAPEVFPDRPVRRGAKEGEPVPILDLRSKRWYQEHSEVIEDVVQVAVLALRVRAARNSASPPRFTSGSGTQLTVSQSEK